MVAVIERLGAENSVDRKGTIWDALFPPRKGVRDYRRETKGTGTGGAVITR